MNNGFDESRILYFTNTFGYKVYHFCYQYFLHELKLFSVWYWTEVNCCRPMNFENVNFTLDKPLFVRRLLDYIGLEHFFVSDNFRWRLIFLYASFGATCTMSFFFNGIISKNRFALNYSNEIFYFNWDTIQISRLVKTKDK